MIDCIDHGRKGDRDGYARVKVNGKQTKAHRLAYCQANGVSLGDIAGRVVRHSCDNPRCVNGDHLLLGSQADNIQDMMDRGRHRTGPRTLSPENARMIRDQPWVSARAWALLFGVSLNAIKYVKEGRTFANVTQAGKASQELRSGKAAPRIIGLPASLQIGG